MVMDGNRICDGDHPHGTQISNIYDKGLDEMVN